jgi:hypothetical protein
MYTFIHLTNRTSTAARFWDLALEKPFYPSALALMITPVGVEISFQRDNCNATAAKEAEIWRRVFKISWTEISGDPISMGKPGCHSIYARSLK